MNRRLAISLVLGVAMAGTSALTGALTPKPRVLQPHEQFSLEQMIPQRFGDWLGQGLGHANASSRLYRQDALKIPHEPRDIQGGAHSGDQIRIFASEEGDNRRVAVRPGGHEGIPETLWPRGVPGHIVLH